MMHAVKEKQLASAELLLDKGANPHHRDKVRLWFAHYVYGFLLLLMSLTRT